MVQLTLPHGWCRNVIFRAGALALDLGSLRGLAQGALSRGHRSLKTMVRPARSQFAVTAKGRKPSPKTTSQNPEIFLPGPPPPRGLLPLFASWSVRSVAGGSVSMDSPFSGRPGRVEVVAPWRIFNLLLTRACDARRGRRNKTAPQRATHFRCSSPHDLERPPLRRGLRRTWMDAVVEDAFHQRCGRLLVSGHPRLVNRAAAPLRLCPARRARVSAFSPTFSQAETLDVPILADVHPSQLPRGANHRFVRFSRDQTSRRAKDPSPI